MKYNKRLYFSQIKESLKKSKTINIIETTGKLGDWLFKIPLIKALKEEYKKEPHYSGLPELNVLNFPKINKKKKGFDIVLSRPDITHNIEIQNGIELCRIKNYEEKLTFFQKGRKIFTKHFSSDYEENRIKNIGEFLGIKCKSELFIKKNPKKQIIINFNVGENKKDRLKELNVNLIASTIQKLFDNDFQISILVNQKEENLVTRSLLKKFNQLSARKAGNLKEAMNLVKQHDFYFGIDCGLSHYSAFLGNFVASIFNKTPKKNHNPFDGFKQNNLGVYIDNYNEDLIINYFKLISSNLSQMNYLKSILYLLPQPNYTPYTLYKRDSKEYKLLSLILALNKKYLYNLNTLPKSIIIPNQRITLNYSDLKEKDKDRIWIDREEIFRDIDNLMNQHRKLARGIIIWAKRCSFFFGTAINRNASDLDSIRIKFPKRTKSSLKKEIIKSLTKILERNGLSINEPHQKPLESKSMPKNSEIIIFAKGKTKNISNLLPKDKRNIEKYDSRIKLRDLESKKIEDKENSLELFYKLESLFELVVPFGSTAEIKIIVNKKDNEKVLKKLKFLVSLGIVYYNEGRLYALWDVRRPQHNWAVPMQIEFEKINTSKIMKELAPCFKENIYSKEPYKTLKDLFKEENNPGELIKNLGSNSFICVLESYLKLRDSIKQDKTAINQIKKSSELKNNLSEDNCENSRNRIINLSRILAYENKIKVKINDKIQKLKRYNLFTSYLLNKNLNLEKTKKIQALNNPEVIKVAMELIELGFYKELFDSIGVENLSREIEKKLLFLLIVKGGGLLDGPKDQAKEYKLFLDFFLSEKAENIEKPDLLKMLKIENFIEKPKNFLSFLAEGNFFEDYKSYQKNILHSKELNIKEFIQTFSVLSKNLLLNLEVSKVIFYRHTKAYQKLFSHAFGKDISFRGSLPLTNFNEKFIVYFFSYKNTIFYVASKRIKDSFPGASDFFINDFRVGLAYELIDEYTKTYEKFPMINILNYWEYPIGLEISFNNLKIKIQKILGEGNFSIVYLVKSKGKNLALKISALDYLKEFHFGQNLNKIDKSFVKYLAKDDFLMANLMSRINGEKISPKDLNLKRIQEISRTLSSLNLNDLGYGDLSKNNTLLENNKIKLIDPAWYHDREKALGSDLVGLLNLVYLSFYKKRFPDYWTVKSKVLESNTPVKTALKEINKLHLPKKVFDVYNQSINWQKLGILNKSLDETTRLMSTPQRVGSIIAKKLKKFRACVELCCGAGMLTQELSKKVDFVIAVDKSKERLDYALNELKKAGLEHKVKLIKGDVFDKDLLKKLRGEVVLIDLPWTNLGTKKTRLVKLYNLAKELISKNIVLKLPQTMSSNEITNLFGNNCTIESIMWEGEIKMKIVYIFNKKLKLKEITTLAEKP